MMSQQSKSARSSTFIIILFSLLGFTPDLAAQDDTTTILEEVENEITKESHQPEEVKHVYRMNYWVSIPFSLVATAADIYAIPNIIKGKKGLTDEELAGLSSNTHNKFDRWALEQDPTKREVNYKGSDYMLPVVIASAAALGFDKKIRKDWVRLLMMYYEMHSVTFSLYNFSPFGPAFQNKIRPYSYYDHFPEADRKGGNNRNSLYSGHTATAAASTFFMVKVYSDYHPELGRKKYLLYGLATVPALVEGYLRMKALAHFPSDLLVGVVIGAVCGVVVPDLHKFRKHNIQLGLVNSPVGPGLSLKWSPKYTQDLPSAYGLSLK